MQTTFGSKGPPCSWFGGNCIAIHRRHLYGPEGDVSRKGVRLSNLIVKNFVAYLCLLPVMLVRMIL